MRAVVTRVSSASVDIAGETVGKIGQGFLVLLGIAPTDTEAQAEKLADKVCGLRVFEDDAGKMKGSALVLDFEDRSELDAYLAEEPYVQEHVWEKIEVERINVVIPKR